MIIELINEAIIKAGQTSSRDDSQQVHHNGDSGPRNSAAVANFDWCKSQFSAGELDSKFIECRIHFEQGVAVLGECLLRAVEDARGYVFVALMYLEKHKDCIGADCEEEDPLYVYSADLTMASYRLSVEAISKIVRYSSASRSEFSCDLVPEELGFLPRAKDGKYVLG